MIRLLVLAMAIGVGSASAQDVPFVVIRSDALMGPITNGSQLEAASTALLDAYGASGQPMPNVMSVWTSYPMSGNTIETLFVPMANDVTGIGLSTVYGSPETFDQMPPLRAMLLHNDFTALPARAAHHDAPLDGYARYLFLLELSHQWGPALQLPGASSGALIGFSFHWSFWLDAGGSPAGGNLWHDNGDGSFDVMAQQPSSIRYSMLDLYLMGLATPDEVAPFGILLSPVVPAGSVDPLNGGAVREVTFPWMSTTPLRVTADRAEFTIDQIITANGMRLPAAADATRSWTLGIVLVTGAQASDAEVATLGAQFTPIANSFAPAFHEATRERGDMSVVTSSQLPVPMPDAGPPMADAGVDAATSPPMMAGGCAIAPESPHPLPLLLLMMFTVATVVRSGGVSRRSRA